MRFKRIYIEITNACNLHCSFCSSAKRPKQFMSIAQFSHILDEIKPFSDYIYLHVLGEPLLHPCFSEFLETARHKGFSINLTTNATLLPQQYLPIAKNVRQVNLSLHADLNGQFPDYLANCLHYGDLLAEQGVYISYRFWNRRQRMLDQNSQAMLNELAVHYDVLINSQNKQRLADRRFLHIDEQFTWPSVQHPFVNSNGTCYGLRQQCAILCDGSVVPCCLDAEGACCLGNIYEEAFTDILEKAETKAIISGFQQGKIIAPLCQRCSYRRRFNQEKLC